MTRVYPYEYVDKYERFGEIKLPPKEAFYRMPPSVVAPGSTLAMQITDMVNRSGAPSGVRHLVTITTYT